MATPRVSGEVPSLLNDDGYVDVCRFLEAAAAATDERLRLCGGIVLASVDGPGGDCPDRFSYAVGTPADMERYEYQVEAHLFGLRRSAEPSVRVGVGSLSLGETLRHSCGLGGNMQGFMGRPLIVVSTRFGAAPLLGPTVVRNLPHYRKHHQQLAELL